LQTSPLLFQEDYQQEKEDNGQQHDAHNCDDRNDHSLQDNDGDSLLSVDTDDIAILTKSALGVSAVHVQVQNDDTDVDSLAWSCSDNSSTALSIKKHFKYMDIERDRLHDDEEEKSQLLGLSFVNNDNDEPSYLH
jgi:hypothetical protein